MQLQVFWSIPLTYCYFCCILSPFLLTRWKIPSDIRLCDVVILKPPRGRSQAPPKINAVPILTLPLAQHIGPIIMCCGLDALFATRPPSCAFCTPGDYSLKNPLKNTQFSLYHNLINSLGQRYKNFDPRIWQMRLSLEGFH